MKKLIVAVLTVSLFSIGSLITYSNHHSTQILHQAVQLTSQSNFKLAGTTIGFGERALAGVGCNSTSCSAPNKLGHSCCVSTECFLGIVQKTAVCNN